MKKFLILLTAIIACLALSGCELELDQKDLDNANKAIDVIEDGVDWVANGLNDMLNGKPAQTGATTEDILTGATQ